MIDQLMRRLGYVPKREASRQFRITWLDKDYVPLVELAPRAILEVGDTFTTDAIPRITIGVSSDGMITPSPAMLDHLDLAAASMRQSVAKISIQLLEAQG
jgi:hypothetical protein